MKNEFYQKFEKAKDVCVEAFSFYNEADEIESNYKRVALATLEEEAKNAARQVIIFLPVILFVWWTILQLLQVAQFPIAAAEFMFVFLVVYAVGGFFGAIYIWTLIWKKKIQSNQDEAMKKFQPMIDNINAHVAAGNRVFEENSELVDFIPVEIRFPQSAAYLMKMAEDNRADSLPAYMELLKKQVARWKEEAVMTQRLQIAKDRAEQARIDKVNSTLALGLSVARLGARMTF